MSKWIQVYRGEKKDYINLDLVRNIYIQTLKSVTSGYDSWRILFDYGYSRIKHVDDFIEYNYDHTQEEVVKEFRKQLEKRLFDEPTSE